MGAMVEPAMHVATREGYDRWSSCYDTYQNPLIALEEPEVRTALGPVAGLGVLDLACGTGRHALRMSRERASVTGVDFSEGMLSRARERDTGGLVRWIQHDLHDPLPFEPSSFDRVVHALALEHLDAPADVLREIRRVLRPAGHAVVSVMHPAMFLKGTQARFVDPVSGDLVTIQSRRYTIADFVMAVKAAGLELLDLRERPCTKEIAADIPRAEKYIDWPMLLLLVVGHRGAPGCL
jgi:ubiquinone/menaquinone biosynthesis C-methylase UbiE